MFEIPSVVFACIAILSSGPCRVSAGDNSPTGTRDPRSSIVRTPMDVWNTESERAAEYTISEDAINTTRDSVTTTFRTSTDDPNEKPEASPPINTRIENGTSPVEETLPDQTTIITSPVTESVVLEDACKPDHCVTTNFCLYLKPRSCIDLAKWNMSDDSSDLTLRITTPQNNSVIFFRMISKSRDSKFNSSSVIELQNINGDIEIWRFLPDQRVSNLSYVSNGYELTLKISPGGNWGRIIFDYQEIVFDDSTEEFETDTGILKPPLLEKDRYMPNLYKTYLLTPSRKRWNASSVTMLVKFVDLDEAARDFLLIGAGKKPFEGAPPVILTGQRNDPEEYFATDEDAYVAFVSGASNLKRKGYEIHWRRSGQFISEPEEDPQDNSIPDYVLKSVQVCFYNSSFVKEFNKTDVNAFPRFRKEMAEIANQYALQKKMRLLSKLTENHVVIYRVSRVVLPSKEDSKMSDGVIYTMVAIVQSYNRKMAVFERHDLEEILDRLDKVDQDKQHTWLGFKVGHCPSGTNYIPWYIAAICLLILSMALFISVWIYSIVRKWRGISRETTKSSRKFCCSDQSNPIKENEYVKVFNVPQLTLTSNKGQVLSLDDDNDPRGMLNFSDEESDTVIFSKIRGAEYTEPKELKTFTVPRALSKAPNSNRLWTPMKIDKLVNKNSETDHVYDCLDPSIINTYLEHEEESRL